MKRAAFLAALLVAACRPASPPGDFHEVLEGEISSADARLDDGTPYDAFELSAREGQRLTATLESEDFDPALHLLAEGDRPIARNDDAAFGVASAKLDETLPAGGQFKLVVVAHEGEGSGAYRLEVTLRTP